MTRHALLKTFRWIHLYSGVLFAPAMIFFALTGAMQTFSLHETTPNSSYKPPAWAVTLGQIHKKQTTVVPVRKQMARPGSGPDAQGHDHAIAASSAPVGGGQPAVQGSPATALARVHHPLPLKVFFLLSSVALLMLSMTGIYMAWKYMRRRSVILALLAAGVVIPVGLLFV